MTAYYYASDIGQFSSSRNSNDDYEALILKEGRESRMIESVGAEALGIQLKQKIEELVAKAKSYLYRGQAIKNASYYDFISRTAEFILLPNYLPLNEETAHFVAERDLVNSISWLRASAEHFFQGRDFEIDLLPTEEDEEPKLALRVYGAFTVSEFSDLRFKLCQAMLQSGHNKLYKLISIFQRRVHGHGWQALSWYRQISAE